MASWSARWRFGRRSAESIYAGDRAWRLQLSRASAALLVTAYALAVVGCGSSGTDGGSDVGDAGSTRVVDSQVVVGPEDVLALGLKRGKEYDVETLTGANAAGLFFWRVAGTAVEYELRFYGSHADAMDLGSAPAEEGSGPDAILDVDVAEYKEGIRDRRTIFDYRAAPKPKFGAYGIYGNVVALCQGRDDAEAWSRCQALFDELMRVDGE